MTAGLKCTDKCGEILQTQKTVKAKHTAEDVAAKDPTATEDGHTAGKKCSVCGEIIEGMETIPATGETNNDETEATPDDTNADAVESTPTTEDNTTTGNNDNNNDNNNDGNNNGNDDAATDEAGCKGVIASAAVLSIVALGAGVVICRKKD